MQKFIFTVLLFFLFLVINNNSFAQDQSMEMDAETAAWMEYMTPGKPHEMMAKNVGEWKAVAKLWWDPSNPEPTVSEGTATYEMILGGRYLTSKQVMDIPELQMKMEGMSLDAYDNKKGEIVSVWIDNMGTGVMIGRGKYDEQTNSITLTGAFTDPMTGGDIPFRTVLKFIDDNKQIMEMYTTTNGTEMKSMEIEYTRR